MHGRPRTGAHQDEAKEAETRKKVQLYCRLSSDVIARRNQRRFDPESLGLTAALLELNPEFLTVWNYRRDAVTHWLEQHAPRDHAAADPVVAAAATTSAHPQQAQDAPAATGNGHYNAGAAAASINGGALDGHVADAGRPDEGRDVAAGAAAAVPAPAGADEGAREHFPQKLREVVEEELKLAEKALRKNAKAYGPWYHRKWVLSLALRHGIGSDLLQRELLLCAKLLDADERNFHGWLHRRFVAEQLGRSPAQERQFCEQKINQNFSNYSAWHYRSSLLPLDGVKPTPLHGTPGTDVLASPASLDASIPVMRSEFELVQNAFFTEPEDQSGWMYHRWLLARAVTMAGPPLLGSFPSLGSTLHVAPSSTQDVPPGTLHLPPASAVPSAQPPRITLIFAAPVADPGTRVHLRVLTGMLDVGAELSSATCPSGSVAGVGDRHGAWVSVPVTWEPTVLSTGVPFKGDSCAAGPSSAATMGSPADADAGARPAMARTSRLPHAQVWSCQLPRSLTAARMPGVPEGDAGGRGVEVKACLVFEDGGLEQGRQGLGSDQPGSTHKRVVPFCIAVQSGDESSSTAADGVHATDAASAWAELDGRWPERNVEAVATSAEVSAERGAAVVVQEAGQGTDPVQGMLREQQAMCEQLLELEQDSKWPMLTLARVLEAQQLVDQCARSTVSVSSLDDIDWQALDARVKANSIGENVLQHGSRVRELYHRLTQVDPARQQYYHACLSDLSLDQGLAAHKRAGELPTPPHGALWVNLSRLGLHRVTLKGCSQICHVRRLDLSHNHLFEATGLECLQQLVSLDLSHNRIRYMADILPGLSGLPQLQALNLSHNLMGAPSHGAHGGGQPEFEGGDEQTKELNGRAQAASVTDALMMSAVRGLSGLVALRSLDMTGNPVCACVSYMERMRSVAPSLLWLDGERLVVS
eukprot:jgi/Mesvir1/17330/Mv07725-RA.1